MVKKNKIYFSLFRIDNYIKNLFVFAPLFFDFQFDATTINRAFIAFILFCFLASGIYIFNDIFDLKADQSHPVKKLRPLASRLISIKKATIIGIVLIIVSLTTAFFIDLRLFYTFLFYLTINIFYNLSLKKVPVLDILIISFGFILRILAGSFVTNIPASEWILIMTFLLSLFLGFSKRRADVLLASDLEVSPRNIRIFSLSSINNILFILAIITCVTYLFYTFSKEVIERIGSSFVFITSIWVVLGIFRYMKLIKSSKKYRDPTGTVIADWKLQSIILLWILSFILLKYL